MFPLLLIACLTQGPEISTLSPATEQHPRQSEGDIELLADGRILAVYTDFYGGTADHSAARIAGRLSDDQGTTWSEPFTVVGNAANQNVMSASLLRLHDGRLMLGYLTKNGLADCQPCVRIAAADDELTFGDETVVTDVPAYYVMNNDRLIQLSTGRIVAPVSFSPDLRTDNHFRVTCFFSDDGGATWAQGESILDVGKRGAMEPGLVELGDGRVLMIIRTQFGRIDSAVSTDGCSTFSDIVPLGIEAPEAPATIARIPDGPLLLVWNPNVDMGANHCGARTPLRCAVSFDEGRTWERRKDLEDDPGGAFAYTSVTFIDQAALLTYYAVAPEHRAGVGGSRISLRRARVPLDWLLE